MGFCIVLLALSSIAYGFLPPQNPLWPAQYNLNASTITMACNSSGWYDPQLGAQFGIVSYDWSNAKQQWAAARPMDCSERLVTQAVMTKKVNPLAKVFVYRNLVKALPWFTDVREKLTDPAYSAWFLRFKVGGAFPNGTWHVPACDAYYSPPLCSPFYHDQEQTPSEAPGGDGFCDGKCDCGTVPCGEYLFDHRNASLRQWLVQQHVMGPAGLGHPLIDGLFIDDFWCSSIINGSKACTDPVQGASEIDAFQQADMGLSDGDISAITQGWLQTMTATQAAILAAQKYTWSLMAGQDNANAMPTSVEPPTCTALLRRACSPASPWQAQPLLFALHPGNATSGVLPNVVEDVATFLLMRGPHAWIGWGEWGLTWPPGVPLPALLGADVGLPLGPCEEFPEQSGVFVRRWSKALVSMDCRTFLGGVQLLD